MVNFFLSFGRQNQRPWSHLKEERKIKKNNKIKVTILSHIYEKFGQDSAPMKIFLPPPLPKNRICP